MSEMCVKKGCRVLAYTLLNPKSAMQIISEMKKKQDRRYSDPKARNGSKIKKKNSSKIFVEKIL